MGLGLVVGLAGWWFSGQIGGMAQAKERKTGESVKIRLVTEEGKATQVMEVPKVVRSDKEWA